MNDAVVSKLCNLTAFNVDGSPITSEGFLAILRLMSETTIYIKYYGVH